MKSCALALRAARSMSACGTLGVRLPARGSATPSAMLSAMETPKSAGSCCTKPRRARSDGRCHFLTSTPPTLTVPLRGSYARMTSSTSVLLPEPLVPTTPMRSPGATSRLKFLRTVVSGRAG